MRHWQFLFSGLGDWFLPDWAGQEKPRWESCWPSKYDVVKSKYKAKGGLCCDSKRESKTANHRREKTSRVFLGKPIHFPNVSTRQKDLSKSWSPRFKLRKEI